MKAAPVIMIAGTRCPPEAEKDYNEWVNEKHIPEILETPGAMGASRYKLMPDETGDPPKYVIIWQWESEEALKAYDASPHRVALVQDFKDRFGDRGVKIEWRARYSLLRDFKPKK